MVMDEGQLIPIQQEKNGGFSYTLQQFEGPLDLLLYLIQKSQVNIYDIPIGEITSQFLEYLDLAKQVDLNDLTDFYLMASQLLLIKSRMLLPNEHAFDDDDELTDPRLELVERLLEYQKYKKYTALLTHTGQSSEMPIERKKSQFMLPFEDGELWGEISVWDLLKTFSSLLKTITPDQVFNVYEEVTTKQKISLMYELFETRGELSFLDIVVHPDSAIDIICAFMAILEAVKFHMITIFQHVLFGDISIRKRDDYDSGDLKDNDSDLSGEEDSDSFMIHTAEDSGDSLNTIHSGYGNPDDDEEIIDFDEIDERDDENDRKELW